MTDTNNLSTTKKNLEIEALRGIAIIITVLAHTRLLYLWKPDWLEWMHKNFVFGNGVDLFFVISGFVITVSLKEKFHDLHLFYSDLKHFLIRRFWRLAPASLFFCVFYLLYSTISISGEVGSFLLNLKNLIAVITLTANMRDQSNLMAVYWTLASEWQFYLAFPFVLLLIAKYNIKQYKIFLIFLLMSLLAWSNLGWFVRLRFDAMLYGVLLGWIYNSGNAWRELEPTFLKNNLLAFCCSIASFFLIIFLPRALTDIPVSIMVGLVSINCALLVWIASYEKGYILGGFFQKPLKFIGVRSYSIYLVHGPSLYLTHDLWYWKNSSTQNSVGSEQPLLYTFTFLIILYIISECSYRFLELPFLKKVVRR